MNVAVKNLIRPGMIFIPFILGILFPEVERFSFMIRWLLIGMFYLICLQIKLQKLKPQKTHWVLLLANLGIGVAGYLVLHLLGFEQLALAAFFIGITPTANAAPVVMAFMNGRVSYVVSGFVITNLGVSLALIVLLPWVTGNTSFEFVGNIAKTLLLIIGLPLLLAIITRRIYPAATGWPAKCKTLSLSAWSCTLFIIAGEACTFLKNNPSVSWTVIVGIALTALVLCILNFWLGGRLAPHRVKRESSQLLGQKNTTFTLYLALTFVNPLVAMGPIFYVFCHNVWNAWQMYRYDRHRNQRALPVHVRIRVRAAGVRRKRLKLIRQQRTYGVVKKPVG